jgi:pimeloyl-ACP methyl ester carboxylesterase
MLAAAVLGTAACAKSESQAATAPSVANASPPARPQSLTREEATAIIADVRKVVAPHGVQELTAIEIGGLKQWISVRGRDRNNPILLYIHGGPASPEMPLSWTFQTPWEDYFTVVQWDQRGAGKTYTANDPELVKPTLTVDRMIRDAEEVTQYLRTAYGQDKIFVVGHSWGSVIGLGLAQRKPQWLYAYVGIGQVVSARGNERAGYEFTLRAAEAAGNAQALKELRSIAPYPEVDGSLPLQKIDLQRKWSIFFGGLTYGRSTFDYYNNAKRFAPEYSEADLAAIEQGSALSLPPLLKDAADVDYSRAKAFDCPIILFLGRHDETTSSKLAAQWLAQVESPHTRAIWFENSAHMIPMEEPGRVVVELATSVRPLAVSDRKETQESSR